MVCCLLESQATRMAQSSIEPMEQLPTCLGEVHELFRGDGRFVRSSTD